MNGVAAVFITQFYNLQGETVKAKQNNLFKLLRQYQNLGSDGKQLDLILQDLKPRFHLERIFYIDFLIHFRIYNELYNLYKRGDRITVKKLAKQKWFFEKICKEISTEEFVNVMPSFSYSLKLNVLKKLLFPETKCDELFDSISSKYGTHLATRLLHKCTSEKISEILKAQPVHLTNAQLEAIARKDANLIVIYLEERIKHEENSKFMNQNPILTFIAQKHPEVFSQLFEKYNFDTKLGRRTTKKLVNSQKRNILEKTEYFRIINKATTVRKLGPEIKGLFFKQTFNGFNDELCWQIFLKYYPRKHQFTIFEKAYNSVHREKFGENVDNISEEMLQIVSDQNERHKLAIVKLQNDKKFLKFTKPEYCLCALLDKVKHTTVADRIEFVENISFSCILYQDLASFVKLAQLLAARFKNDDGRVQSVFIKELINHEKFLQKLDKACWDYILDVLSVIKAKGQWIWNEALLARSYLEFLSRENRSLKEALEADFDWISLMQSGELTKHPKLLQFILKESVDSKWAKQVPEHADCTLGFYYYKFNKKHPDKAIDIAQNQRLLNSCKHVLENSQNSWMHPHVQQGIGYLIFSSKSEDLQTLYFKNFARFGSTNSVMWLLKHKPQILWGNFDDFFATFHGVWDMNCKELWHFIKKIHGLDAKAVDFFKLKLSEEDWSFKTEIVKPLTMLSEPETHLEYIKRFVPKTDKVDLTDGKIREFYLLQGSVCSCLHLLNQYKSVLESSFDFCKGDYLQSALAPLYNSFYNLAENETRTFMQKMSGDKALSLKKHAVHLSCVIYDNETALNCLKQTTVPSLMIAIQYFARNPSIILWSFIQTLFQKLKKNDVKILKVALSVNVPFQYKSRYLEQIWNVLDRYEDEKIRKKLIKKLNKHTIPRLEHSFAFSIIENSIFASNETQETVCAVLIYLNGDEKFKVLRNVLQKFKENVWDQELTEKIARQKLKHFVVQLFNTYTDEKEKTQNFVKETENLFKSLFPHVEIFEELVLFQCLKFKTETVENAAKILSEINKKNEKEYGIFAVNVLADVMSKHVFLHILKTNSEKIRLCYALLQYRQCISDSLLIVKLLPKKQLDESDDLLYAEVLNVLNQTTDNVLLLELNLHLNHGLSSANDE